MSRSDSLAYTLLQVLEQQPDSADAVRYLRQQQEAFAQNPNKAAFYRVFTAMPRFVGKQPVRVSQELKTNLNELRPDWPLDGWTRDRLARVWWLLQLPPDDADRYVETITNLFRSGEWHELEALYSALPVLAFPERWRFQATEGIRNNIADVQAAIMLNNPYPAEQLDEAAWNQLVMKAFFTEKDISQIVGLGRRNNARLAHTLRDYVAERRAAGRDLPHGVELLLETH